MSPTKACSALINEPLSWFLTPHGDGYALGWKGDPALKESSYNLFANYYQPKGASPVLCEVNDISYIYLPNLTALNSALHLFFHVNAVRDGDVMVTQGWKGEDTDESPLEYVYSYDETEADRLATLATEAFVATIKHSNFIPSIPKPHGDIYYMGKGTREEYSPVEDYASAATA